MKAAGPCLVCDHITVALDLAAGEHQVVIVDGAGKRLTRFSIAHSRPGIAELLRRSRPERWDAAERLFAFEATGHVWEAVAHQVEPAGQPRPLPACARSPSPRQGAPAARPPCRAP